MDLLIPEPRSATPQSALESYRYREPGTLEFLGSMVSQGYDYTIARMITEDLPLAIAGTGYAPYTKKNWEESEYYREGIEWDDSMTGIKAQILSEDYDKRRYRESVLSRYNGGMLGSTLGFGAMMAAQFLDPTTYIPFVGVAGKLTAGARAGAVAATTTRGAIAARAAEGAADAFLGAVVTEPFISSSLRRRGEDVQWSDAVFDIALAPIVGGIFGSGSEAINQLRPSVKRRMSMMTKEKTLAMLETAVADLDAGVPVNVGRALASGGVFDEVGKLIPDAEISKGADFTSTAKEPVEPKEILEGKIDPVSIELPEKALEAIGIDPRTGNPAEVDLVNRLLDDGRIKEDDAIELRDADKEASFAQKQEDAVFIATDCIGRA